MPIARVEPLTSARALRGPFDYKLPQGMGDVGVGSVLVVPFGHQRVLGVVVAVAERSELPPERLAEPIEALAAGVSPELVRLGLWVGHEYCSTPARGLGLVLPPGTGPGRRGPGARRELRAELTPAGRRALDGTARLGSRQRAALGTLRDHGRQLSARELATACGADRSTLGRLAARGLVRLREIEAPRRPTAPRVGEPTERVTLTEEQRRATETIVEAIAGPGGGFLLHGVTGSGKTEVYLAAAEAALAAGRGAIMLVPEIGLTPQTLSRFQGRFGDRVALLHSRLSPGERRDESARLRSGAARVAVGPRSAVFAPVSELGLIVIDEEHDPAYKQEGDPRYDARDVARRRAVEAGATLVCGTATPRPETWLELPRLELPERVDGRSLPEVEVLDMRRAAGGPFHSRTREALDTLRREGGKAIVLLNRRGWAPFLGCRQCGWVWECPGCDVSLVLHQREGRLRCHHCGHAEAVPDACPECGSVTLTLRGSGTERLEVELTAALEPLPIFRLDSDSAAPSGAHLEVLRRFQEASTGVLVGTQMVAKGHDFADVVLSVVLDADATLRFPDFRAEERTFALVAQLAGRSGRGEAGGRVLVQTLAPDAPSIRAAAQHDAPGFLTGELERRRQLRYPPFSHLIRVELTSGDEGRVQRSATAIRDRLLSNLPEGSGLLGPAPRFRRRGRHRRQLLLKGADRAAAVIAVREATEEAVTARELRGTALSVDVDPQ